MGQRRVITALALLVATTEAAPHHDDMPKRASLQAACTYDDSHIKSFGGCAEALKETGIASDNANLTLVEFAHGHPPFSMTIPRANFDKIAWINTLNEKEYAFHTATAHAVLSQLVPAGEKCHVIDIGGNIGYVSLMWASFGCEVETWEANPGSAKLIKHSLGVNSDEFAKRVDVHNAAISSTEGELSFAVMGQGSIYDHTANPSEEKRGGLPAGWSLVKVPGMPLPKRKAPVTFIKIDCEGCEPIAAQGLKETLKNPDVRPKVIQTEWIPHRMAAPGADSMVDVMEDAGYEPRMINGQLLSKEKLLEMELGDLFFVLKDVANFECVSASLERAHVELAKCRERPGVEPLPPRPEDAGVPGGKGIPSTAFTDDPKARRTATARGR